jgi:hypothetical protein
MDELATRLNYELPPDTWDGQGWQSTGVENSWDDLRQVQGYPGTPYGTPPRDAAAFRVQALEDSPWEINREFAKNPDFTKEDKERCDWIFDLMTGRTGDLYNIPIKRSANMGLWWSERGVDGERTARIVHKWNNDPDSWVKFIQKGDMFSLAEECAPLAYMVGYRFQLNGFKDGLPKPRKSWSIDNKWEDIDFTLPEGIGIPGFYAVRPRVINMGSIAMYPLRIAAREVGGYMKKKYPFTFLTTGIDDITKKCDGAVSLELYDVKNHDWSGTEDQFNSFLKALGKHYEPWVVQHTRKTCYAPDFVRSDKPGFVKTEWRGAFRDEEDFLEWVGNRSGNPFTSEIAKQWGVYYIVEALIARGDVEDNRESVDSLLRGQNARVRIVCAGDNICVINLVRQMFKAAEFCKLAVLDEARTFLGWTPIAHQGVITWMPACESVIKKFFHSDASIGGIQRSRWADGVYQRMTYYDKNPAAVHAWAIANKLAKEMFGETVNQMADRHYLDPNIPFEDLNEDEKLFMLNPEYIHYRITAENIRPELMEGLHSVYYPEQYKNLHTLMVRAN